jgi:Helix-turn-helix domain
VHDSMIGVGSALRKARERRGITLDAASRDTKLHIDQLRALESEDFEALLGDVYVRGSLRTYSQYLGLSPDKVIGAYARHAETPPPPPPPARLGRIERAMAATRIRDNQWLMVLLAGTVLVIAVVFGLLSRGHSAPDPATLPTVAAEPDPLDRAIDAVILAVGDVGVTVTIDGVESTYAMAAGETRTFTAENDLGLSATDGGAIRLTVNGVDYGIPGTPGLPWRSQPFRFGTSEGATPSAGA